MSIRFLVPLLALSVVAAPARAEPGRSASATFEERQATYKRGINAMLARDWLEAERIFSTLWREQQSWDVAVSLGQCELNLRRYRDAAEHLSVGLRLFPVRDKRELFEAAKAGLEEAKKHVGTLVITVDRDDANVLVDGAFVGRSPLPSEVFVEPGARRLEAQREGFEPAKRDVLAEAGKEHSIELTLAPRRPVTAEAPSGEAPAAPRAGTTNADSERERGASFNWVPAVVGGAVAIGGVGMFLGFTAAANGDEDDLEAFRDRNGPSACAPSSADRPSECASIAETGRSLDRNRNWATAGLVVAGTAVVGTAAYYLVESALSGPPASSASTRKGSPSGARAALPASSPRLGAAISPGFAAISVVGSF